MTYGAPLATMYYSGNDPLTGDPQDGPSMTVTPEQFKQLPPEQRKAWYDIIAADMISDDAYIHVSPSMVQILAFGIMFESPEWQPDVVKPTNNDKFAYTSWLRDVENMNPQLSQALAENIDERAQAYFRSDEYAKEMSWRVPTALVSTVGVATGTVAVLGGGVLALPMSATGSLSAPTILSWAVGSSATINALANSNTYVRLARNAYRTFIAGNIGMSIISIVDNLINADENLEKQNEVIKDKEDELSGRSPRMSGGRSRTGPDSLAGTPFVVSAGGETTTTRGVPTPDGGVPEVTDISEGPAQVPPDGTSVAEEGAVGEGADPESWIGMAEGMLEKYYGDPAEDGDEGEWIDGKWDQAYIDQAQRREDYIASEEIPVLQSDLQIFQRNDVRTTEIPNTWVGLTERLFERGQLQYGTPSRPIPQASAKIYTPDDFGKPGYYRIEGGRQKYLTNRNAMFMTSWMATQLPSTESTPSNEDANVAEAGPASSVYTPIDEGGAGYQSYPITPIAAIPGTAPQESYYLAPDDAAAKYIDNYGNTIWREPKYKESTNDAWFAMRNLTTDGLASFQANAADAGWIQPGWLPGVKDKRTLDAIEYSMGAANVTGEWWKSVVGKAAVIGRAMRPTTTTGRSSGGFVRAPFVKRTYIKPDYEEMSLAAKRTMRQGLGRDPKEWEMKMLADKLGEEHQRQFDVTEEGRWKDYKRGTGGNKFTSESLDGVLNPVDVMTNYFEKEWAPELNRRDRVEAQRRGAERFFNSMLQTDSRLFSSRSEATTQKVGE